MIISDNPERFFCPGIFYILGDLQHQFWFLQHSSVKDPFRPMNESGLLRLMRFIGIYQPYRLELTCLDVAELMGNDSLFVYP